MKLLVILFTVFLFHLIQTSVFAQGCSDAGFCTMGGLHLSDKEESFSSSTLTVGSFFGFADNAIMVSGALIDYQYSLSKDFTAGIRATSLLQSGKQTTQFGLSDVFFNGVWNASSSFSIVGGVKIPLQNSDRTFDSRQLPMDYQSSLGTFDVIGGVSYSVNEDIQLQVGFQAPLTQNKNLFTKEAFIGTSSDFADFQNTLEYHRAADLMFRANYTVVNNQNFSFSTGILPIYHLANDTYISSNGTRQEIVDSKGLTFNVSLFFHYSLTNKSALELTLASPVKTRAARPDGLTRGFISSLDYKFSF